MTSLAMHLSLKLIFSKSAVYKGLKICHASSKSSKIYCPKQFSQNVWPFLLIYSSRISSVQSLSRVQLFATPWTIAYQAPCPSPTPEFTQIMSIESVMLIQLSHPLLSPSPPAFITYQNSCYSILIL